MSTKSKILHDYDYNELVTLVDGFGEKVFRAKQLLDWLISYKNENEITNIPKKFLQDLASQEYIFCPLEIYKEFKGKDATKFLLKTTDSQLIECVLMQYKHGNTLCVSTQIGCRMGCKFCASGESGLIRNLSNGEILAQVLLVNRWLNDKKTDLGKNSFERMITNVVLMGSGEPFDNYQNVVKFLKQIISPQGLCISPRNISLSTSGLVPGIIKFADEGLPVTLSISLHATTDENRCKIMPVAKAYKLKELFSAIDEYENKIGRRVCFEYMVTPENSTIKDAERLGKLLSGKNCFVNLIVPNFTHGQAQTTTKEQAYKFGGMLKKYGLTTTIRRSLGADIEGACGQLKRRILNEDKK